MQKKLIPAYLLTFVNVLGFSILMPVLPFVVSRYNAPDWVYGLLLTLYSSFQFLGAPYLGAMSDRIGRKPVLLISQAGTLFSWFVFLLALFLPESNFLGISIPLIIIALSRVLDGITGGNSSVTNAYVSDVTTREEKSFIFGYLGGIAGIGLIIGPGLGGLTASGPLEYVGTMITAIIISSITLISILVWLKESHPKEKRSDKRQSMLSSVFLLRRMRELKTDYVIRLIFVLKSFFSVMMALYFSTISLFLIDLFDFKEKELGIFMLVVGIFLSFNQAIVSKLFIKRLGEFRTLILGLLLCVLGLFSITLTSNLYLYIAFYYVMNLGLSLCFPTFNALISIHADPEHQGETMGVSESINSFAMAAFPVLGAACYGLLGYSFYYIISALPLIALIIALMNRKHVKE